jgi:hypothetical protein
MPIRQLCLRSKWTRVGKLLLQVQMTLLGKNSQVLLYKAACLRFLLRSNSLQGMARRQPQTSQAGRSSLQVRDTVREDQSCQDRRSPADTVQRCRS